MTNKKIDWRDSLMTEGAIEILLVEDSPGDIRLTKESFKESKFLHKLNVVMDGVEAMDFLNKREPYTDVSTPDLILLDLNLPKKDGREVLKEIKSDPKLQQIPVIVLTTSESREDVAKSYNLHANCYMVKPVSFEQFVVVVRSIENFWFHLVKLPPNK